MLKGKLIHPQILSALGSAGHGSTILIPDGNYPFETGANPLAERVYLNLAPGMVSVTDVLEAVLSVTPVEAAHVMARHDGAEPSVYAEFRKLLPADVALSPLERFTFYDEAKKEDCCLVIATGEQRIYANILLTIGVVDPPADQAL
ncbi:MAG: RbsD/FucU family protein [Chloroflexota bacterium]|nr:RbsD/FucU family protein [Chloroflexota bacterium]MYE26294.1 RbsD or FucU transport [Chloroflexota bacterium]